MVWTGTSSAVVNRATPGVLANDTNINRKVACFSTVLTFTAEVNPVAVCFTVPKGFRPLLYIVIGEDASGGTLTGTLGDAGSAARISGTLDVAAAHSLMGAAVLTTADFQYTEDTVINFTLTGTPTAGAKQMVTVLGTVPW